MKALVLAGSDIGRGDPLLEISPGGAKALLPVAGRPMIRWVLDALAETPGIDEIIIAGLDPAWISGQSPRRSQTPLPETMGERAPASPPRASQGPPLLSVPNRGSLLGNLRAAAAAALPALDAGSWMLAVSSDIPAVTPRGLEWVLAHTEETEAEFIYFTLDRKVMEQAFPGNGRTYLKFRDASVCGGDVALIRASLFSRDAGPWDSLVEARKNPLKLATRLGPRLMLRFLAGKLTLQEAVEKAGRKLGLKARVISCPYPELGMDVDKPFQREIVEHVLRKRSAAQPVRRRVTGRFARGS